MVHLRPALALAVLLASPAAHALDPAPPLPRFVADVQGGGTPGVENQPLFLWGASPAFEDRPTLRVDRQVPQGTGKPGNTYKAIWALGSTNPHNQGYEWTITGEMHNTALVATGAQNVAINGTIFKEPNGLGPVGPSWAGNFNCVDATGEEAPVASCVGVEIDVSTKTASADPNRQRVGAHISAGGPPGTHVGYGLLVSPSGGAVIDRALALHPGDGAYGIGLDTTAATFSVAPIVIAPGQAIALDGTPGGTFQRFLAYNGEVLMYGGPGGAPFQVNDLGVVYASSYIEAAPQPPPSSRAPCRVGQHAWDPNYEYRCVAPNTWRRAALSAW